MQKNVILIRHAEATKNVEDRHGGIGGELTARGTLHAREFAKDAVRYFGSVATIISGDKPQCIATAGIFAEQLGLQYKIADGLQPFYLGVLDGLSKAEAMERYPTYAQLMERWRRGFNEIDTLNISGASDLLKFYEQGILFEERLRNESMPLIFVGTRSLLVLMWNVFRKRRPISGGGYFERPWQNLEWVEFSASPKWRWREERTQRPHVHEVANA